MNKQKLQLVSFEQAKKLDKIGFDWETRYRFDYNSVGSITETSTERNHNDRNKWTNKDKQGCSAPTVALALKWFRDVKRLDYKIQFNGSSASYCRNKICDNTRFRQWSFATYESAESALLDELLTLIEK